MTIKPIRSDEDHREAVEEIRALWKAQPGSEAFDRLDVLATLVDGYERKRWPIDKLDPIEAMEADGHTQAELASLIGKHRASEILARKRPLTLRMIRAISAAWHVPTSILVKEYSLSN